MAVGEAFVEIGVDFSALRRSLSRAKEQFAENAEDIERNSERQGKDIGTKLGDGLSSGLKLALAGIGAFIAGALMSNIAGRMREIIDLADDIGKSSKRIGITVQEMQKLSHAASLAGTDMASVEIAMRRMQSTVFDAANGLSEANRALGALGLSVDDLKGKTPHTQFELIAEALNEIENASDKAAIAQDVFGRAGTALIPMLDNYRAIGDELERVGGIMSGDAIKAAEDFNDALADLTVSAKAAAANSGLIKWLSGVADGMNSLFKLDPVGKLRAIAAGLTEFSGKILPGLDTALSPVLSKLTGGLRAAAISAKELAEERKRVSEKQEAREKRAAKRLAEEQAKAAEKAKAAAEKAAKDKEKALEKEQREADKMKREEERAYRQHLKELERAENQHKKRLEIQDDELSRKDEEARKKEAESEKDRLDDIRQRLREIGGLRTVGIEALSGLRSETALEGAKKRVMGAANAATAAAEKHKADNIKKAALDQIKNQEEQISLQKQTIAAIKQKGTGSVFSTE
jgi:hypothetical protein